MPRHVIVVPCYGEEERLDASAFRAYAAAHPHVHFVLVDDGSPDGTRRVLDAIAASRPEAFTVVGLDENAGKAEAVRQGVRAALKLHPASFGYWDADLSTPLEEIGVFVGLLEAHRDIDVVLGSRVKLAGNDIQRKTLRHYAGRVFATCASLVLGLAIYDTQCGAKLFRSTPANRWAFRRPFLSRWLFDVEILARLGLVRGRRGRRVLHARIHEHSLPVWRDVAGSKLKPFDFVKSVWDLARIGVRYRCCAARRH
jgi:dolichyl-phosphate beta-glucosyltransferase